MTELKGLEKLKKGIIKLQSKQPFFAYLSLYLKFQEDKGELPNHAGMGVSSDGNLIYKTDFVDNLSDEEVQGVLCHEIMHLALLHLLRMGSREQLKWNVSCDLCTNNLLHKNNFRLPHGSLLADSNGNFNFLGKLVQNVNDKTAEELYDILPDIPVKYVNGGNGSLNGFDEHIQGKMGSGEKNKEENKWLKRVSEAYTSSKMRGTLPMGLERYIEELKKSQINWRALLQKYLQSLLPNDYSWSRKNKKSIACNTYLPSVLKEKIDVCVMVDLSGSIGKEELTEFMSEIIGLAKAYSQQIDMRLMTHDTKVHNDYKICNGNIDKIKKIKLQGGGGTDFDTPLKYIEDNKIKPKCLIWLTDGYGNRFEKPKFPIIWVLNKHGTEQYIQGTGKILKLK